MWQISLIPFLISLCIFVRIMVRERRTLWSGVSFFGMLLFLAIAMFFLLSAHSDHLIGHPGLINLLVALFLFAVVGIVAFPAVLILTFFIEGIQIIRREGAKPSNLLSMLFSVLLYLYLAVWPAVGNLHTSAFSVRLYAAISLSAAYLLSLMAIYSLSAMLNLIHIRKRRSADYIVVLGAGLSGDKVTPLLSARIDKGIALLQKNPNAVLILSGGQGPGEDLAEGEAMAAYAAAQGVAAERMLIEDKSRSTEENLRFSRALMDGARPNVIVVTTAYHVFRALLLARQQGIRCVGFGAKTKWYFTLNALLREFVGYLHLTWKKHACAMAVIAGISFLIGL